VQHEELIFRLLVTSITTSNATKAEEEDNDMAADLADAPAGFKIEGMEFLMKGVSFFFFF
jgi:hypothetical protein